MKSIDSRLIAIEKRLPASPIDEVLSRLSVKEIRVLMEVLKARIANGEANGKTSTMTAEDLQVWRERGQFEFANGLRETVARCREATIGADKIDVPYWALSFEDTERAAEVLRVALTPPVQH